VRRHMGRWKLERARAMRRNPTEAEAALWPRLRCRRLLGLKFIRQARAFGYILDFYCASIKLAVEVDGSWHRTRASHDRLRDERLAARGVHTVRVTNEDVFLYRAPAIITHYAVTQLGVKVPPQR
jgi:ATP-dependent DNA helicase RecQ